MGQGVSVTAQCHMQYIENISAQSCGSVRQSHHQPPAKDIDIGKVPTVHRCIYSARTEYTASLKLTEMDDMFDGHWPVSKLLYLYYFF